jgi:hypothetical protein
MSVRFGIVKPPQIEHESGAKWKENLARGGDNQRPGADSSMAGASTMSAGIAFAGVELAAGRWVARLKKERAGNSMYR